MGKRARRSRRYDFTIKSKVNIPTLRELRAPRRLLNGERARRRGRRRYNVKGKSKVKIPTLRQLRA